MLELVRLIVEVFAKAIPGVASKRRTDKLADLGTRLFMLYVVCNEMLLRGERIVVLLEELDTRGSVVDPSGDRILPQYWDAQRLIVEQGRELVRIKHTIDEWAPHVQILSGDAYNDLMISVARKGEDIGQVADALSRLGPAGRITDLTVDANDAPPPLDLIMDLRLTRHMRSAAPDELMIPYADHELVVIRDYLIERAPRAGLAPIRESLERFRTALTENFTLADILPRVEARTTESRRD